MSNDLAFLEVHALQVAGNARAHFDCMHGFQAAGELVTVADLFADDFRHTHFRWHRSLGLSRSGTGAPGTEAGKRREADDQHQPPQDSVVLTLPWVCCFALHLFLPSRFPRFLVPISRTLTYVV